VIIFTELPSVPLNFLSTGLRKDLAVDKKFFYKFTTLEISEPQYGGSLRCPHKHCIISQVWKQYQSANEPRQNGLNTFG